MRYTVLSNEALMVAALREGVADFLSKSEEFLDYLPEAVHRALAHTETKRKLLESEALLREMLLHDPLTGLSTRIHLKDRVNHAP